MLYTYNSITFYISTTKSIKYNRFRLIWTPVNMANHLILKVNGADTNVPILSEIHFIGFIKYKYYDYLLFISFSYYKKNQ